jgi:hypothetical protein
MRLNPLRRESLPSLSTRIPHPGRVPPRVLTACLAHPSRCSSLTSVVCGCKWSSTVAGSQMMARDSPLSPAASTASYPAALRPRATPGTNWTTKGPPGRLNRMHRASQVGWDGPGATRRLLQHAGGLDYGHDTKMTAYYR